MTDQFGNYRPGLEDAGETLPATSSGAGDAQVLNYTSDPNTESVLPSDQFSPAIAVPTDGNGPWYSWNKSTHVWQ